MEFKCFNGVGHGKVDLEKAIAYSCNGYFIKLTEQMKPEELLSMAEKLGFGSSVELAPGMSSSAGNLPVKKDLSNPKAKANFSFGQGDLLATPLQIDVYKRQAGNPLALPVLSLENRSGSFRPTQWLKACGGRNAFAPGDLLGLRQYFLI